MENMNVWLRHPVLSDPSFDTFEKLGETVHQSEPPYKWAVNGSLFCDPADGAWYYFSGLYGKGYNTNVKSSRRTNSLFAEISGLRRDTRRGSKTRGPEKRRTVGLVVHQRKGFDQCG